MSFIPVDLLRSGADELGVPLSDEQLDQMDRFASFLVETNKHLNLTRITDPRGIVSQHYLDSLACLSAADFPHGLRVIDVGTGAGIPGIPIKIARPDLSVAFLDSTRKKLDFITRAAAALGLDEPEVIHARAEDAGRDPAYREQFDIALARALAQMQVASELCLPLVRVGGMFIAQKSDSAEDEIKDSQTVIGELGGKVGEVVRVRIPHTNITRHLVIVSKQAACPNQFPRAYSKIARSVSGGRRTGKTDS